MKDALHALENSDMPVRKTILRARWFVSAFRDFLATAERDTGQPLHLDEARLLKAFGAWYRSFEAQKHKAQAHRQQYVTFAAGLMLREMVRHAPVTATGSGDDSGQTETFWPEGRLYVSFCLAVRDAVIEQDFSPAETTAPCLDDLRTWWSFRENVKDDVNLALGFFEEFVGETPNWATPGIFSPRPDATDLTTGRAREKLR